MAPSDARAPWFITVDVEGDDLWSRPREVTTRNAEYLPRFHRLCVRHGLRPVYLATYEMATCPAFRCFAREVVRGGEGEIGMHLHAWDSPPFTPLTDRDDWHQPFATRYPHEVLRAKIDALTVRLEDLVQGPVVAHRGGRWALDAPYARMLAERGYRADCTVTPLISWRSTSADEDGAPDYTGFPTAPYLLDLDAIDRAGASPLLEVPMTTCRIAFDRWPASHPAGRPSFVRWLRPNGRNIEALRYVVDQASRSAASHLMLMVHSSELMPGGSPALRTEALVEGLYRDLDRLFAESASSFRGLTLGEYRREFETPAGDPT